MHRERPFFGGLVKFMTEGPIVVMALEREDAIKRLREVMGATNPANAAEGTIRKRFAEQHRAQLHSRIGCSGDGGGGVAVLLQHRGIVLGLLQPRPVSEPLRPRRRAVLSDSG